ncbi:adenylosuccinate synthetase [Chitinophaga sedimenti]|uniref:adenylosuccinate synthetase n=1 Tax=Chitinophaga sedimenti TaxID=2033606 RepID=UPI00249EC892|nr:adenylosuccinate synthetase [Chitinophaga sedimenti]
MAADILLGLQWGDEGKGKIVDVLSANYDLIARFQGGPNAGHTLVFEGQKFVLNTLPSGIFLEGVMNLIGNGVVIDPIALKGEIIRLRDAGYDLLAKGNLLIAKRAHLILPTHKLLDAAMENAMGDDKIGTTGKGIGPAYTDKVGRKGLRMGDKDLSDKYRKLTDEHIDQLQKQYGITATPDDDAFSKPLPSCINSLW